MSDPEPYLPVEPPAGWPAQPPAVPTGTGPGRVGRVEGAVTRQEGRGNDVRDVTVMAFRLVDPQTGVPTEVELRGRSIAGTVRDGDWVQVPGAPTRSGRLEPVRLHNLTTRSEIAVHGSVRSPVARVAAVLFILLFLVVLVVIIVAFVSMGMSSG